MAYLKSTTIGGKLNVIGTLATNEATIGSTTVNGIATSITNDDTKLATAKAVYDYITSNAGVMSSTASGKTVTTKVTTGGWFAKNATSSASVNDASGFSLSITDKPTTNITVGAISNGYYPLSASLTGTFSASTPGWFSSGSATDSSVVVGRVAAATITANNPTVSVTNGAVTPSVGGTVTSKISSITTTKPSGTDGTDYVTINPGAAIATQPTATPSYKYSATAGYTPAISSTTKTGTATNVTPTINGGTNYYLPKKTPAFDGGGLSGGGLTAGAGSVSATGSSITLTEVSTKPRSGYYVTVTGSGSVSRAAVTRAAVLYNGAVNGWVNIADNTAVLSADSTTIGATSKSSNTATKYYTVSTETKTATTSGDITPTSGKLLSKVNVPAATPKFDGGGLSGGGLSITTNYSGTPTVTVASGSDTNMTNITVGAKAQSGYPYYFKVSSSSSALSGKTKATRAAVTRAAVKYNGAVDGWVEVADNTNALAADSTTIGSKSVEPTVTVNAGSGSTYVGIKAAVITNGFVTGAGYMPDDDTAAYKTQYNSTDDCVDILFN